jgi:hypothetical protein
MRNVSEKSCRGKRNTHFIFSNFFPKMVPFMRYVEKYGTARQATDDNIIRRMRFACRITEATGTHSEFVTLTVFAATMVMQKRLNVAFVRTSSGDDSW